MKLFIVGQVRTETEYGQVWDLQGVFDTEDKAVAACHTELFFVSPIELNYEFPIETIVAEGTYAPLAKVLE